MLEPESRFTAPRPDCPHPEYWHSTDSDSTELEVSRLVGAFVGALQPEVVVETGTAFGQTANYIGWALQRNGHGHLFTLEPDPERAEFCRERLSGLPVTVLEQSSLSWMPPEGVDFAWFDSLLDLRVEEFGRYRPMFSNRCVVGFHDMGPQHPLAPAVRQLPLALIELPTPRGVAFGRII